MKDTLKTLELLEQHIDRVVENGLYEIERDLLLERLRGIYATVVATEAIAEEERVLDALIGIGATTPLIAEEEPEIEIERIYAKEEDCEVQNEEAEIIAPAPEVVVESETEPEIAVESEPVVAEEEPTTEPKPEPEEEEPSTEDEELAVVYKEEEPADDEELDHEAVMALYDDDDEDNEKQPAEEEEVIPATIEEDVAEEEEPESISEPEPTDEEPAEEAVEEDIEEEPALEEVQTVVLGDILASEQTTIADNLAEQMVASAAGANASLRSSIALNDKFILMRDLFAGNNDYYEMAIERLDSFDNLEEAMLYIHDTFHWNPNSEGARLLMELLARKLF